MSKPKSAVIAKAGTHVLEAAPASGALEILGGQFSVRANNSVTFPFYEPPLVEEATSGRDISILPAQLEAGEAFVIKTSTAARTTVKWRSAVYQPAPQPIPTPEPAPVPVPPAPEPAPEPTPQPPAPVPTPVPGGTKSLPDPSAFQLRGFTDMALDGLDSPFMAGLTCRVVNGVTSFFSALIGGTIVEYTADGTVLRRWANALPSTQVGYVCLSWDEAKQRLWTFIQPDYGGASTFYPLQPEALELRDDGTVQSRHSVTFDGISGKGAYGGATFPPASAGLGVMLWGWGGYTSLVAQASKASMGTTVLSFDASPLDTPNGSSVTPRFLADHTSGARYTDWYAAGAPSDFDRGHRLAPISNYCDGGDPRSNPDTEPAAPPVAGGSWLSPAPDGKNRWVFGDSYFNTGCWIETDTLSGLVLVASVAKDRVWYQHSSVVCDGRQFEWHVLAPAQLAEAKAGTRAPWNVQPETMTPLAIDGAPLQQTAGGTGIGNVVGATFDGTHLYLLMPGVNTYSCRLVKWRV